MSGSHPAWALDVFHDAARRVPAYADFLARHKIAPDSVQTLDALTRVPCVTKDNYLRKYELRDLLLDGAFGSVQVVSTSSGSSGEPFYWPRGAVNRGDAVTTLRRLFDQFDARARETLAVVSFAMGNWIAGTYHLDVMQQLHDEGYPITTITPGIDVAAGVRALSDLSPAFEQTILQGYPPLVKDVLDAAIADGVDLAGLNLRLVLAGEAISEAWRGHVASLFGGDPDRDVLSIYGTADMGAVGVESSATVWIRRKAAESEAARRVLFGDVTNLPTLVEIDPGSRLVEASDGFLLLTARGVLPLIRYAIGDVGWVRPAEQVRAALVDVLDEEIPPSVDAALGRPLVAIGGRPDVAASFYALNVYPENIKHGLEQPEVRHLVSGKFVVSVVEEPDDARPTLRVVVELADGADAREVDGQVRRAIIAGLVETNAEYRQLHSQMGDLAEPVVTLGEHGQPEFAVDAKHRWTEPW